MSQVTLQKCSRSQVTCLFWFENGMTLKQIEHLSPHSLSYPTLCTDSTPNIGFRKWAVTLLSTTQVTQNVIILALYFIWKLKSFNPTVKGRPGSEYRLLTVALMLGNKCKIWCDHVNQQFPTNIFQFLMTIPTRTRHGLKCQEFQSRRSTLWRSSFSAT